MNRSIVALHNRCENQYQVETVEQHASDSICNIVIVTDVW